MTMASLANLTDSEELTMSSSSKPHLKYLADIERDCISGLVEVMHTEGVEDVRLRL